MVTESFASVSLLDEVDEAAPLSLVVNFLRQTDSAGGRRPSRVEGQVIDHLADLLPGHPVVRRPSEMAS